MITVKQELRVYGMPGGALELRLTDLHDLQEPGVTWGEPLEAFVDNHTDLWGFQGFQAVLSEFRSIERIRSVPNFMLGIVGVAGGIILSVLSKPATMCASAYAVGAFGVLTGLIRRKALMFRDDVGNVVDLFLGIVYVGGYSTGKCVHFQYNIDKGRCDQDGGVVN